MDYSNFVELEASDKAAGERYGTSVAVSGDGSTVVVGAQLESTSGTTYNGAAYVYTGASFESEQKLLPSDPINNGFAGRSVAVSEDGSVVVVGANNATTPVGSARGAVYVYSGSGLATETKLYASDGQGRFGESVACSADGSTIVVGAINGLGAVYVYSGTTWGTETKIAPPDLSAQEFGYAVACTPDGTKILVGERAYDGRRGRAHLYSGTSWTTRTGLAASDGSSNDDFGWAVAMTPNAGRLVIGATIEDSSPNTDNGAVYIYEGSGYGTETKLLASTRQNNGLFGYAVAVTEDGAVIVGAPNNSPSQNGYIYVFGDDLTEEAVLDEGAQDAGWSVSCSYDGAIMAASDPTAQKVYVYGAEVGGDGWGLIL